MLVKRGEIFAKSANSLAYLSYTFMYFNIKIMKLERKPLAQTLFESFFITFSQQLKAKI